MTDESKDQASRFDEIFDKANERPAPSVHPHLTFRGRRPYPLDWLKICDGVTVMCDFLGIKGKAGNIDLYRLVDAYLRSSQHTVKLNAVLRGD